MAHTTPTYGIGKWELGMIQRPLSSFYSTTSASNDDPSDNHRCLGYRNQDAPYRWFARCLLEGAVLIELRKFRDHYKEHASIITAMKPSKRMACLLLKLVQKKVMNKSNLLVELQRSKVEDNKSLYLSAEILDLIQVEYRQEFRSVWSKLAIKTVV